MSDRDSRVPDPEQTLGFVPEEDEIDATEIEPLNEEVEQEAVDASAATADFDLDQTLIEVPRSSLRPPAPSKGSPAESSPPKPEPGGDAHPLEATVMLDATTRLASEPSEGPREDSDAPSASGSVGDTGTPSDLSGSLDSSSDAGPREERPVLRTIGLAGSPIRGKLIRRLGGGGFGEVFEVDYADCVEAWKFIPKERTQDNAVSEEVRNAMRLCRENPGVVKTFGVHIDIEQKHWIIRMERVPGRDLHRIVQEDGIFDVARVIDIGCQVADALHFSHTQFGIVHQDIKPKNLVWDENEHQVRITDFGISVSLVRSSGEAGVRGTPVYMAPEQLDGNVLNDGRVDQWAFGVTLYFLLTGRLPFDVTRRRRRPSVVYREMREQGPVPLVDRLPIIDPELDEILSRCFAWDPADRYPSLGDVSAALTHWWETFPNGADSSIGAEARSAYRAGQIAFTDCRFEEARREFERVVELESDHPTELSERARVGMDRAESTASDLEDELAAIRGVLEEGDLSEGYQRLTRIEPRFSRSRRRKEMIGQVEVQIQHRWEHARPEVKRLVELTEFSRASHYVKELRQFLDHRSLKWKLLGSDASRDETGSQTILHELDDLIDERQADFCEQFESMESAIEQQRFRIAQEELGKLQNRFPQRKSDFERFGEALARAVKNRERLTPIRLERLKEIRVHPDQLSPSERLDFGPLIQACEQFLEDFPPERYENMLEYARLRDELSRLRDELGERVRAGLEEARRQSGDLKAARDIAARFLPIVRQTDLLSSEESSEVEAIVSRFETRHELCREREEQARASLEARRWDQALIQLEECERLGPDDPQTIQALILQARQNGLKARELEDRLRTQRYNLLSRTPEGSTGAWEGYLQEIVHYLYDARELTSLQDEDSAARTRENARLVFLAPLDSVRRELEQAGTFRASLEILQRIGLIVHDGAPRFQPRPPLALVREDGTLHEKLVELFEALAGNLRQGTLDSGTLAMCETLIEELTPWAELLREIELPERHPIVVIAASIRAWAPPEEEDGEVLSFEERCRRLAWQEQIIRSLVVLGPNSIQPGLQSIADAVAGDRRREVGSRRARRAMRTVRRVVFAVALMLVGGATVWLLRDGLAGRELGSRFETAAQAASDWSSSEVDALRSRFDALEEVAAQRSIVGYLESLSASMTSEARLDAWLGARRDLPAVEAAWERPIEDALDSLWEQRLSDERPDVDPEQRLAMLEDRIETLANVAERPGLPARLVDAWRTDVEGLRALLSDVRQRQAQLSALWIQFERAPALSRDGDADSRLQENAPTVDSEVVVRLASQIRRRIEEWPSEVGEASERASDTHAEIVGLGREWLARKLDHVLEEILAAPGSVSITSLDRWLYYHAVWSAALSR